MTGCQAVCGQVEKMFEYPATKTFCPRLLFFSKVAVSLLYDMLSLTVSDEFSAVVSRIVQLETVAEVADFTTRKTGALRS